MSRNCFAKSIWCLGWLSSVACQNAPAQPAAVVPVQPAAAAPAPVAASLPAAAPLPPTAATPVQPSVPLAGSAASAPLAVPAAPAAVAGAPATAPAALAGSAAPPPPAAPVASVKITIPGVAPGEEDTKCVQVKLATSAPLQVVKLHNQLSPGSHHYILTALSDPMAAEKALARCQGFAGSIAGAPLSITQAHDDSVVLPEGIGYGLRAGQVLHLEMHYINTTDRPLDISASTELFAAPPGAQLQEGAVLLVGTADINVPPHGSAVTPQKFLKLPAGMEGVKFYAITGHTHAFGTKVEVALAGADKAPIMPLYAPAHFDWEAPENKPLAPHVSVPTGGGFLLSCGWTNTTDTALGWGESATDEMCFFWGYYYPRKDVFSIVVDNIDQATLRGVVNRPPPAP